MTLVEVCRFFSDYTEIFLIENNSAFVEDMLGEFGVNA